ncbi:MAG: galactose-1-phosphate uridylyltransferase [Desulfobacterota bacterium]|jgi:UDPglucose--hexose-1-phosphate uridylyltransferase|nr:galactose-1-phosphate uridylyltransferase [Thermodesulfobacteriota bacterium]
MPELRKDPIVGRWVIISTERAKRPFDFAPEEETAKGGFCPFDPGNEKTTPPEIVAYRPSGTGPNTPGWTMRVVANKFPALVIEGGLGKVGEGLYDKMNGIGAHEVIIETPDHAETLSTMPLDRFVDVLRAYRDRIVDLSKDPRFRYILIFKNQGRSAGASLEHSHSQLIALPVIPEIASEELNGSKKYFSYKDRCVYCDILRQEIEQKTRVISENEDFLVCAPFAPRSPFEVWIIPKSHNADYTQITEYQFRSLAEIFSETLRRLDKALNKRPYNFMLHTSPVKENHQEYYHWHFEVVPKLTRIAGFEWGSGFYINPTPPEEAAKFLRDVSLTEGP